MDVINFVLVGQRYGSNLYKRLISVKMTETLFTSIPGDHNNVKRFPSHVLGSSWMRSALMDVETTIFTSQTGDKVSPMFYS